MPAVVTELAEGVLTLTLNQPDRLNALSSTMVSELSQAVRTAERDDAVRAVVVTGAGRGFCSGADVTEFSFRGGAPDLGASLREQFNPLIARIHALEKPVL